MEQIDVIKRLIRAYPDDLQYATSAQGKYRLPSLFCFFLFLFFSLSLVLPFLSFLSSIHIAVRLTISSGLGNICLPVFNCVCPFKPFNVTRRSNKRECSSKAYVTQTNPIRPTSTSSLSFLTFLKLKISARVTQVISVRKRNVKFAL